MNNNIEKIAEAIRNKRPIEFNYHREGKKIGKRIGWPHIIFSGFTKEQEFRTWLHLVQTEGVSDTLDIFPDWRMFIVNYISNVEILYNRPKFEPFEGYNPESDLYKGTKIIEKVSQ